MEASIVSLMLERRYGKENHDWLYRISAAEVVWTMHAVEAMRFVSPDIANLTWRRVRSMAQAWPNAQRFIIAIIHDRSRLPSYWLSSDAAPLQQDAVFEVLV